MKRLLVFWAFFIVFAQFTNLNVISPQAQTYFDNSTFVLALSASDEMVTRVQCLFEHFDRVTSKFQLWDEYTVLNITLSKLSIVVHHKEFGKMRLRCSTSEGEEIIVQYAYVPFNSTVPQLRNVNVEKSRYTFTCYVPQWFNTSTISIFDMNTTKYVYETEFKNSGLFDFPYIHVFIDVPLDVDLDDTHSYYLVMRMWSGTNASVTVHRRFSVMKGIPPKPLNLTWFFVGFLFILLFLCLIGHCFEEESDDSLKQKAKLRRLEWIEDELDRKLEEILD
ncbi:hypothetical protein PCE1_002668 [Barthelona sp. PCE]